MNARALDAVPPGLRALRRWVGHRDKRPLQLPTWGAASVSEPATWGTFEEALAWLAAEGGRPGVGVGLVFAEGDGLVFVDLDHVTDDAGRFTEDGRLLVKACGLAGVSAETYVERSPSGTGFHVFALGELPPGAPHRRELGTARVEVYSAGRYSTVTGRVVGPGALGRLDPARLGALLEFLGGRDVPGRPAEAPEPERLPEVRDALSWLDPDCGYEEWLRVGMALKAGLGTAEALALWSAWSAQGRKYVPGEPLAKWASFTGSGVGLGTIFRAAEAAGWRSPAPPAERPEDVFEDLGDEGGGREGDLLVTPLSLVAPERVDWLWRGRLALGHLALFAGDGGQGKSILTLDLAARVSRGAALPGEPRGGPPRRVLLLNAEDGQADTIRPRAEAAGADLTRIVVLDLLRGGRPPQLPDDAEPLERLVAQYGDVALLVLDPLNACIPVRLDAHKDQHVRQALWPLARLAQRRHLAAACVVHLNKAQDAASTLYRVSGSVGLGAAARSVLFVGLDPEDEDGRLRVVTQAKPQLGPPPPSLSFGVEGSSADPEVGVVRWHGESSVQAGDLVRRPEPRRPPGQVDSWLRERLAGGPASSADVFRDAKAAGIGRDAVYRAQRRLGVHASKSGSRGEWTWELPAEFEAVEVDSDDGSGKMRGGSTT